MLNQTTSDQFNQLVQNSTLEPLEISRQKIEAVQSAFKFLLELINEYEESSSNSESLQIKSNAVTAVQDLLDLNLGPETIVAALMSFAIERYPQAISLVINQYGNVVASLIREVLDIEKYCGRQTSAKTLQKLILTTVTDVRVVLILLCRQLVIVRELDKYPRGKSVGLADEIFSVYAPLAGHLGINRWKSNLEDLAFHYLNPELYKNISDNIDRIQRNHHHLLAGIIERLRKELSANGFLPDDYVIVGRPKHIYSIYKKMNTPKYKERGIDRIYDKLGVRVIVDTIPECYSVLGIIHSIWLPIPGEFDDYIGRPLPTGYRSLHTAVRLGEPNHDVVEFQIRTNDMHYEAENGIAAHWRYKDNIARELGLDSRILHFRQILENLRNDQESDEVLKEFQAEPYDSVIYVFSPKGDVFEVPTNSTPIDFAYQIHTEVGHRCRGARVNGKMVSLDYRLKSGEKVEIITAKRGSPNRAWMNISLGYTASARTRSKIRQWFRQQEREQNIQQGREVIERELKRLALLDVYDVEDIARALKYDDIDDFLAKIGFGDIQTVQITGAIALMQHALKPNDQELLPLLKSPAPTTKKKGLTVRGVSGLHTRIAGCCNPISPEPIIGYITRGEGITIHSQDCKQVQAIKDRERLIEVSWGTEAEKYPIPIIVTSYRRGGLIEDLVSTLRGQQISVPKTKLVTKGPLMTAYLIVEVVDLRQLNWLLTKLENLPNVIEARRQQWS